MIRMRAERKARNLTQAELARETGLTQQYIAKIEKGLTSPRPKTLRKIKSSLGEFHYPGESSFTPLFIRDASISKPGTTWIFPDSGR